MSELDQASNGGLGLAFLLSEMRDFRKGLEARDDRINNSIDGLREDVTQLSTTVAQSQDHVKNIEKNVDHLGTEVSKVRSDVDTILAEREKDAVRKETAWAGPLKAARNLAIVGTGIGAILVIASFFGFPIEGIRFTKP